MDHDHVQFAGLTFPSLSEGEFQAMELGFMWNAVWEFMDQPNYDHVIICLHIRWGATAMQMGDRAGLNFTTMDGCRQDKVHVVYTRKGHQCE